MAALRQPAVWCCLVALLAAGCQSSGSTPQEATTFLTTPLTNDPPRSSPPDQTPANNENPLTLAGIGAQSAAGPLASQRLDVVLTVLHVQVPHESAPQIAAIWNHLRENLFDVDTTLRLRRNGLRVGVSRTEWWGAVQTVLNAVSGIRSIELDPLRVPPNYPLAFELDTEPRDQTIFFADGDGVLTGETWPQSRNVFRISYALDYRDPGRVQVALVPEVRQRQVGFQWIRNEIGLTKQPKYSGRALSAAGFFVDLEPGEFLLVAPGPRADVYGLVGRAFLGHEEDGRRFDSYVFLRVDVNNVAQRY